MKRLLAFAVSLSLYAQTVNQPGNNSGGTGGSSGSYSTASAAYTTAAPYFLPPGGGLAANTTESVVQGLVGVAGTISNFTASLSAAPGSNTITFTWRKATPPGSSADQTVTCAITGSATSCKDNTHSFPIAIGDLIDIKAVATTGTVTAAIVLSWGVPGSAGPAGPAGPAPGGTGAVLVTGGVASTLGAGSAGTYPRSNGTNYANSAIQAADVPTLNQNTTGTAGNLSGTPTLPNGTAAVTQSGGDNSTKLATTAYVDAGVGLVASTVRYVSTSGNDAFPGTTWLLPKRTVKAAVNSLPVQGTLGSGGFYYGNVYIGPGLFTETGPIQANADIHFHGTSPGNFGEATTIKQANGVNDNLFSYTADYAALNAGANWDHWVSFDNLVLDGNNANNTTGNIWHLYGGGYQTAARNVQFQYAAQSAVYIERTAVNWSCVTCIFIFNNGVSGNGGAVYAHDTAGAYVVTMQDIQIDDSGTNPIYIEQVNGDTGQSNTYSFINVKSEAFSPSPSGTHAHVIYLKPRTSAGGYPVSITVNGMTSVNTVGGADAVIYEENQSGPGGRYDLSNVQGVNYTNAFKSARNGGETSATNIITHLSRSEPNTAYNYTFTPDQELSAGSCIWGGLGSPVGLLVAHIGCLYVQADGVSGATLFVKESGNGASTGWIATSGSGGGGGGTVSAATVGAALITTDSGAVNAYAGCPSPSVSGTPADGVIVSLRANAANTGATTFALCGGSAIGVKNPGGSDLVAGEIQSYASTNPSAALIQYGTTAGFWVLLNPTQLIFPAQSWLTQYKYAQSNGAQIVYARPVDPSSRRYIVAEANGSAVVPAATGSVLRWTYSGSGSLAAVAPSGSAMAAVRQTGGSGGTDYSAVDGGSSYVLRTARNLYLDTTMAFTASPTRVWILLAQDDGPTISAAASDTLTNPGIGFRNDNANWFCVAKNGAQTNVNSGVAFDANQHRFEVRIDDSGPTPHWLIDGTEVCTGTAGTNIPTGANLQPVGVVTGASNRIDFAYLYAESAN